MLNRKKPYVQFQRHKLRVNDMIPNLDQLLFVCGIALAGVGLIVWLLLKLPNSDEQKED